VNEQKEALKAKFSADYERYYLVDLFKRRGFVRKKCKSCGRFFWTLDADRKICDDQPCSTYTFIGRPVTDRKMDRIEAWKLIEGFFSRNGHTIVKRYPVVSRWRPDLYFTVASIIDFQRIEGGKVVFQLPANPLVVPQMCLRFNDIPNVGVSGKHGTSFVMVGQTAIADKEGYWKDRCIDLDFELMTKEMGIKEEEITFNEDVWVGYGAFGYSLEYFIRGLETGNAVFTAFEGTATDYREMSEKVVDMGAGLEKFSWLSQGTPTVYDSIYSTQLGRMKELQKVSFDDKLFLEYSRLAGLMNADEFGSQVTQLKLIAERLGIPPSRLQEQLGPIQAMYAVADHAQTLLFAIADGMLPSNAGGGYNLRVLFRRAVNFIEHYGFQFSLADVVNWHIDDLSRMYPELEEHRGDVQEILGVEMARYASSSERVSRIVSSMAASKKKLTTEDLIRLYDSDGVTPEQLEEAGAKVDPPADFYEKVQARHETKKTEDEKQKFDVSGLPDTKLLYYEDAPSFEFRAKVLKVLEGKLIVLDRTFFYPRGGGQEPDRGTIDEAKVVEVIKYGDIVLHRFEGPAPRVGGQVSCTVDSRRRTKITRIHTATHIINGSSRQVLGPWVWQHSAFKEEDYGRLDITHYAHLTREQVGQIESLANEMVRRDLPVTITFLPKEQAEEKYGFKLYQGGVVPSKTIRVVNVGDWDIEACGGTHVRRTGEVGLIKIVKVERVQDGVERIEFNAGEPAIEYVQSMDGSLDSMSTALQTQRENLPRVVETTVRELEAARAREKALGQALVDLSIDRVVSSAKKVGPVKAYVSREASLGEEQIIAQGEKSVAADPSLIYVSLFSTPKTSRVLCFVGPEAVKAGYSAGEIARKLSAILGGSGGGSKAFAQGGGPLAERLAEAFSAAQEIFSPGKD